MKKRILTDEQEYLLTESENAEIHPEANLLVGGSLLKSARQLETDRLVTINNDVVGEAYNKLMKEVGLTGEGRAYAVALSEFGRVA